VRIDHDLAPEIAALFRMCRDDRSRCRRQYGQGLPWERASPSSGSEASAWPPCLERAPPAPIRSSPSDVKKQKLDLARELGATHCIDAAQADATEALRELSHGGVQYAIEFGWAASEFLPRLMRPRAAVEPRSRSACRPPIACSLCRPRAWCAKSAPSKAHTWVRDSLGAICPVSLRFIAPGFCPWIACSRIA